METELQKIYILIPAYQPDEKLLTLTEELVSRYPVVVVDDGSDPRCGAIFSALEKAGADVLHHEANQGKGAAMKTGLAHIAALPNAFGVITADADGQHAPEDIGAIAAAMRENPGALILGCRDFSKMPPRSRIGNTITRFAFRTSTGLAISDTQTGLRGLPRELFEKLIALPGCRYEYEMNMLTSLNSWNASFHEVPISTIYIDENRSSHFNAIRDGLMVFTRLGKYLFSSLASTVIDYILYCLGLYLGLVPALAYASGRVVSSVLNYELNRRIVFKSKASALNALGYAALAGGCLVLGSFFVTVLTRAGLGEIWSKLIVDIVLFFFNYYMQKHVVFRQKNKAQKI